MKILIVGSNSIHVSSFISSLTQFEKEVYLLSEENCNFNEQIIKEFQISFRNLNPISICKNYSKLKNILRELKPDIIHIHQINRLAFFVSKAAKGLKIPVISTAWGSDVLIVPFKNFFYKYLVSKTLFNSFVATADSLEMNDKMKLITSNKLNFELIQYGIDIIEPVEKENIIYSNRLHKSLYRIDDIITYFFNFQKKHTNWKLVIAGTGDQTQKLKSLVSSLGLDEKIDFVGWLKPNENRAWYAKSKVYISIPISDGTSVSVLEAMSAGCIPIVSDLKVSKEWIQDGVNGIIENKVNNPLMKIEELNYEVLRQQNLNLVKQKAQRKVSTQTFISLYKKATQYGD